MARKAKQKVATYDTAKELWINPRSNIRGPDGNRAWNNEGNISANSGSRFLELADAALGAKKPPAKHKKAAIAGAHPSVESTHRQTS